jgi:hypothetical protein
MVLGDLEGVQSEFTDILAGIVGISDKSGKRDPGYGLRDKGNGTRDYEIGVGWKCSG